MSALPLMLDGQAWLYTGTVYHRRRRPREHELRYRVFSLLLDIDRIGEIASRIRWFSHNRLNLVSFHDRDFGVDAQGPKDRRLRDWVENALSAAGMPSAPQRILLSCYPRVLGYAFNPLSLYYCENSDGKVYAVVHEVHNTFGERHAYVLPVMEPEQQTPCATAWIHQLTDKELFVSPFAHMNLRYHFRLNTPGARQIIVIRAEDDEGVLITASYTATRHVLTAGTLLAQVARMPFMTFKVMLGIHYEALKLWIKRVPLFSHIPKQTDLPNTLNRTESNPPT